MYRSKPFYPRGFRKNRNRVYKSKYHHDIGNYAGDWLWPIWDQKAFLIIMKQREWWSTAGGQLDLDGRGLTEWRRSWLSYLRDIRKRSFRWRGRKKLL